MHGVLVVDKPAGPTSFDVVRIVRGLLKVKKAGHTGTLDPMATGVLPICLGDATKVAGFITEGDKAYDAVIRLGAETDTLDAMGKVTAEALVPVLSEDLLEGALAGFRGVLQQVPPMYSAVKIAGKRLYEHARAGEEVAREPRQVTVHELKLRDYSSTEVTLSVRCSKGFFVRSLAQELGRALGTYGHLKALRRTQSGPFTLAQALPLGELPALWGASGGPEQVARRLVPLQDALSEMPAVQVPAELAVKVAHGVPIEGLVPSGRVRVLDPQGQLLAIAEAGTNGRMRYCRVLV
jgi:tRNA pseudouridine55 synthase